MTERVYCPICGAGDGLHEIDCDVLIWYDDDDEAEIPDNPPADNVVSVHGRPVTIPDPEEMADLWRWRNEVPDDAPRDPVPTEAQMIADFALLDDTDWFLNNDDAQDGS